LNHLSKDITACLILCAKLIFATEDKFFRRKLFGKLSDFISALTVWGGKEGQKSVLAAPVIVKIKGLLELLEYLEHSAGIEETILLSVKRNLMNLELKFLKLQKESSTTADKEIKAGSRFETLTAPQTKIAKQHEYKPNSNKEKILDFIKKSPRVRTKEIIDRFSLISDRTVKRSLAELIRIGLVQKKLEDRAVYYYSADIN